MKNDSRMALLINDNRVNLKRNIDSSFSDVQRISQVKFDIIRNFFHLYYIMNSYSTSKLCDSSNIKNLNYAINRMQSHKQPLKDLMWNWGLKVVIFIVYIYYGVARQGCFRINLLSRYSEFSVDNNALLIPQLRSRSLQLNIILD